MLRQSLKITLGILLLITASITGLTPTAKGQNGGGNTGGGGGNPPPPPPPTSVQLQTVLSGLSSPVFVTSAHDGTNRLFIVQQTGQIRVAQPGATTTTVFLDVTSLIVSGGEQGLLGLAFHPQYAINGRFFIYYTRTGDGTLTIVEYHVSAGNPNVADPASANILLTIPHPTNTNHNGGMMAFGPDGFLYMGTGDGGSANDPPNNAQNINVLLGKMLRIDVDTPNGSVPYSSPSTNPFFGSTPGADEIYAYGLRNPWRWSFDRQTGQLIEGDVGQSAREEINIITNGGNYGWRVMEGTICNPAFNGGVCTPPSGSILPIFDYSHVSGRCSITGGYIYRGFRSTIPVSAYVYADFCTGEIWQLQGGTNKLLLSPGFNVSSFGEDEAGEIYVVNLGGAINKLVGVPLQAACSYTLTSNSQTLPATGAQGSLTLMTGSDCGWQAAANVPWITLSQTSGAGSKTLTFTLQDNTTGSARTGLIHIGGQTFTVQQSATGGGTPPPPPPSCNFTLAPSSQSVPVGGGAFSVTVKADGGCSWHATPSVPWITITSSATGSGSGKVTYTVEKNKTGQARQGIISIGNAVLTVTQSA